jgi:hypothetical protein
VEVNYWVVHGIQEFLPLLLTQGAGHVATYCIGLGPQHCAWNGRL